MDRLVVIGASIGTHGLKGVLKFQFDLIFDYEVLLNQTVFFKVDEHFFDAVVLSIKPNKNHFLLTLDRPYNNIDEVEKFIKHKLYANKELIHIDYVIETENYLDYEVILNSEKIGIISEIITTKSSPVLRIKLKNSKTTLLPMVNEYVKEVDDINKKIIINRLAK